MDFNRSPFLSCFADVVRLDGNGGAWDYRRREGPREAEPPTMPADEEPPPEPEDKGAASQQFCLRWNNYQSNLTSVFDQLLQSESFVDVTLACDGHSLKAHKMILSACSPYFRNLFFENPCRHPIVIMRDVTFPQLKAVVEFMYKGEINVSQEQLAPLLKVAESLKIRGLAEVNAEHELGPPAPPRAASRHGEPASAKQARKRQHSPAGSEPPYTEPPAPPPARPPPAPSTAVPPLQLPAYPMHPDDMEIKPGIAEMIREEERVSLLSFYLFIFSS